jgi:NADPH:quinone reductase-like Zn-dependent oxidoreductase
VKAIVFNEYGGPEVLHYSEVSDPSAGPGEIVVNVHAASINWADDKIRSGGGIDEALFPHILGETVLIHGAAGGVGTFAVQLARHLGAKVIGTASSVNQHYVQRLGAHQVIDYSAEDFRFAMWFSTRLAVRLKSYRMTS